MRWASAQVVKAEHNLLAETRKSYTSKPPQHQVFVQTMFSRNGQCQRPDPAEGLLFTWLVALT